MAHAMQGRELDIMGNPDTPPVSDIPENPEEVRRAHLNTEASIQAVGALYYLGALILVATALGGFFTDSEANLGVRVATATLLAGVGVFQLFVGTGLRRLMPWARIPTAILSGIGMLGFPVGTLVNGYILYLVLSRKGALVFTDGYKAVVSATPDIKYKTPKAIWILLGLLIAILFLAIVPLVAGR